MSLESLTAPVGDLSDVDLESFIVLIERRIEAGRDLAAWADRYVELVHERHARVMARGKAQAEELYRAQRTIAALFEETS